MRLVETVKNVTEAFGEVHKVMRGRQSASQIKAHKASNSGDLTGCECSTQ